MSEVTRETDIESLRKSRLCQHRALGGADVVKVYVVHLVGEVQPLKLDSPVVVRGIPPGYGVEQGVTFDLEKGAGYNLLPWFQKNDIALDNDLGEG